MGELSILLAFGAGLLSFLSPCVLPLYPAFLSYITGMSVQSLKEDNALMHRRSFLHTVCFLLGFSIIFLALGFSSSWLEAVFIDYQDLIRQIGAIVVVVFGFMVLGVFQPQALMKERRMEFKQRPSGYAGSVLIGLAFSAGWTPCIGPILTGVLVMMANNPGSGMMYMLAYIAGFSIPFLALSFFIGRMQWIKRSSEKLMKVGGGFMIAMGILLFFDGMTMIIRFLSPFFGGFQGF